MARPTRPSAAPSGGGMLAPPPHDPSQQFWDPEAQTMPVEARRALQLDRLRAMVAATLDGAAPLFGDKVRAAGITDARALSDIDDVSAIPTTLKQELRDSEAASPPFGAYRFGDPRGCVRLGQSTGTTGTPTIAMWTHHDIWIEYESAARTWWRNGWRPGQIITHAHPAYLYGGGVMLSGSLEYFGMLNVWVAPPDTDELAEAGIRFWQRVRPDVSMVAFSLGRFSEVADTMGVELPLPPFEFRGADERGLPFMTAGLECYAYAGGPCGAEPGGHVHEDWAIVQAVDPRTGREVPDGEWGNLVVTTLGRDNGLLRYDLEEAVTITRAPCPCGETTMRAFWGGRFKDFLDVQGKYFQVAEVERALRGVPAVAKPSLEFVVVRPTDPAAPLQVRVECAALGDADVDPGANGTPAAMDERSAPGDPRAAARREVALACAAAIHTRVGVDTDITVLPRASLARSGYKATRLVDP